MCLLLAVSLLAVSCGKNTTDSTPTTAETTISDQHSPSADVSSAEGHSNPFYLLHQAFVKTKSQLLIILELLAVVLLFLSLVLYLAEHFAQPKVYRQFPTSLLWTFVKSIQDPGEMAPPKPVTLLGRVVANIIGLVGVALFALPAGIISSGFIAAMDDEKQAVLIRENTETLQLAFERKKDRPTGYQIVPRYISVVEIQARLGLKEDDILDVVSHDDHYRLINLSVTQTAEEHPQDKLAVEHYLLNTPYGQCIDRGSKVTIFSPSNIADPIMGWWSYYLAMIGGFNYVSRELGQTRPYQSFYVCGAESDIPGCKEFMDDMNRLVQSEDCWVFTLMPASGANEPTYPTQFHFGYGTSKGDTTYSNPQITLNDTTLFESFYRSVSALLADSYDLGADKQRYHDNSNPKMFARHLDTQPNAVILRVAWSVTCWDMRAIKIAQDIARQINTQLLGLDGNPETPELTQKGIGYGE